MLGSRFLLRAVLKVPLHRYAGEVERVNVRLQEWRDDAIAYVFGHIADGNLHIFVGPFEDGVHHDVCDEVVYGSLEGFSGSISAEHGIGMEKKRWLPNNRSEAELELMRGLKRMLDPQNLLNPGKVFD